MPLSEAQAGAEVVRRRRMRESLVGFAESVQIPGAPLVDDGDIEFEFDDGSGFMQTTTLNDIDELSVDIEDWARKKSITKAIQSEYSHIFAPLGSGLALHHRILLEKIQICMETDYGRLMVFMPPGSAKSTYATVLAPTWAMGKDPGTQIILASYATPIAKKLGSRGRFVVEQESYRGAFNCTIDPKSQAKEMWALDNGSEYMSGGLLSGLTGNRASGVIIDDPVKGRQAAESKLERERTLAAFEDDLTTRLKPRAWQILIQCLVGDTGILLVDGSEKLIRDIEIGDRVMSWRDGKLEEAEVTNWANKGLDSTYTIKTSCDRMVRANERHPFLVERNGEFEWVRLRNLQVGDRMVVPSKDVIGQLRSKRNDFAGRTMTGNVSRLQRKIGNLVIGATIGVSPVRQMDVMNHEIAKGCVSPVMQNCIGKWAVEGAQLSNVERLISSVVMESHQRIITLCSKVKMVSVQFAISIRKNLLRHITSTDSILITATNLKKSGVCSVTNAISDLDIYGLKNFFSRHSNTCGVMTSEIVSIEKSAVENVYDIEVTPNENFIANGFVSHNTRWNQEDLAGSILPEDYAGQSGPILCRDGMVWEVLNIPGKAEFEDDPLGREIGEYLWPEWFDEKFWEMYEPRPGDPDSPSPRRWAALFQQRPRADTGNMFDEKFFNRYELGQEPGGLNFYCASDYATLEDEGDCTEHGIAGLDNKEHLYIVDWFYGQVMTDVGINELLKLCKRWNVNHGFGETGIIRQAIEPAFNTAKRQQKVRLLIDYLPTAGKKTTKALSFQHMVNSGRVYIPRCPWGDRLIDQLCDFPGRSRDDAVDVCGLFGRALLDMQWSRSKVKKQREYGPVFGSWEWLCQGTEEKDEKQDRVF